MRRREVDVAEAGVDEEFGEMHREMTEMLETLPYLAKAPESHPGWSPRLRTSRRRDIAVL